ncbi:DUF1488 domain-containing protein [Phyllobacterium sp. 628]|uniref:DUF1488 domain-containing protein n=1 Tax=Phyllobacterium sp. 628 TaxID=2718938 RepID=UPI0016627E28|nr:DUF1488 domain-containing protein [Phyllobacterium sp. 628]QND51671.1 DUF1488 domain-containing protein [Phyllobacterium sp. 628]
MALNFPNRSRSYDAAAQQVRFIGYDGLFQVPFLVEIAAFWKGASKADPDEDDYLAAFDAARSAIQDAAHKAYAHGRKNLYVLTAGDVRG